MFTASFQTIIPSNKVNVPPCTTQHEEGVDEAAEVVQISLDHHIQLLITKGRKQKRKNHFTPYSGFTPGTWVFTHYTPARQSYSSNGKVITKTR